MNPIVRMMKRYIKMPLKKALPLLFICALVLVSISGCTSPSNTTTPTPTITPTPTPDPFLEKLIAAYKKDEESAPNRQIDTWDVTWNNNTSASLHWTYQLLLAKRIVSSDQIITVFPTTQAATNYVNALNLTAYKLSGVPYQSTGGAYRNASGHAPQIYKDYVWNESGALSKSEYTRHDVIQLDTIVNTIKANSGIAPTPTPTPTPTETPAATLSAWNTAFSKAGYEIATPFKQNLGAISGTVNDGGDKLKPYKYDISITEVAKRDDAKAAFNAAITKAQQQGYQSGSVNIDPDRTWSGYLGNQGFQSDKIVRIHIEEPDTLWTQVWDPFVIVSEPHTMYYVETTYSTAI